MIPTKRAHLLVAALSHPGMKGKNNEDRYAVTSYLLEKPEGARAVFAIVADGIGGHRAGEVAAEMAVDYITENVAQSDGSHPLDTLKKAIQTASQEIVAKAASDEGKQGMGSTCACAWIIEKKLYTATVGDSRIYLLRGATIRQLSTDHTWVQEAIEKGILTPAQAREHPNVHVIRRYLGSQVIPEPDFRLRLDPADSNSRAEKHQGLELKGGDILLLCSDGLTDLVWDDEILEQVRLARNLDAAAKALIDLANERGGHDNITVVLMSVPPEATRPRNASSRKWWYWGIGGAVMFFALLTLALSISLNAFIRSVNMKDATKTPSPTPSAWVSPAATSIEATPTLAFPTFTPPPSPTQGPTYTPWPTNTP